MSTVDQTENAASDGSYQNRPKLITVSVALISLGAIAIGAIGGFIFRVYFLMPLTIAVMFIVAIVAFVSCNF